MANATLITASINLDKIDKSKIVKGEKGNYLNLTMWLNEEADQFGNHVSLQQSLSKEEREAKADKIFLGNGKKYDAKGSNSSSSSSSSKSDLPF